MRLIMNYKLNKLKFTTSKINFENDRVIKMYIDYVN